VTRDRFPGVSGLQPVGGGEGTGDQRQVPGGVRIAAGGWRRRDRISEAGFQGVSGLLPAGGGEGTGQVYQNGIVILCEI
jgi:hypothetical protein